MAENDFYFIFVSTLIGYVFKLIIAVCLQCSLKDNMAKLCKKKKQSHDYQFCEKQRR